MAGIYRCGPARLLVAHQTVVRHGYHLLPVAHHSLVRHKYVRSRLLARTTCYPWRTNLWCVTGSCGTRGAPNFGAPLVSVGQIWVSVEPLSSGAPKIGAPRVTSYPWRTTFWCATGNLAAYRQPRPNLPVAHVYLWCATSKAILVAHHFLVRHG